MVYRLDGLRHHAVVGCHHQDHQVSGLGATRPHRGESLMAGGIEESDHATRRFHMVGTDVLRDTTCLTGRNLGTTDVIQKRSLAMIDVPHHGHYRGSWLQLGLHFGRLISGFVQIGFRVVKLGSEGLVPHLLDQNHRSLLIDDLVDGDHRPHLHQHLDDLGRLDRHLVCEIGNGDCFGHMDIAHHRLAWRGK